MKKMNRIISFLIVLCMVLTMVPFSAFAVVEKEDASAQIEAETAETTQTTEESGSPLQERNDAIKENHPSQKEEESTDVSLETLDVTVNEVEGLDIDLKTQGEESTALNTPDPDETVRLIVVLEGDSLLDQGYTAAQIAYGSTKILKASQSLVAQQEKIVDKISDLVSADVSAKYNYSVAINGFAVEVPYGAKEAISELDGVEKVFVAPQYSLPDDVTSDSIDTNMVTTSQTFGSALTWDELGYTGAGMRIAIIDTGLDTDHPSFVDAPAADENCLTVSDIENVLTNLNAYASQGGQVTAADLYISEKVPYGYNYVDESLDVTHDNDSAGDHGTHVSGIAAANAIDTTSVVGVAPDAQILVMKVFGANGGANFDDIMAALEDCFWLDADAVNMSLGSPAGFTDAEGDTYVQEVFERIEESDMIVSISAGNSYSAAYMNALGTDLNFSWDPDNGIVSSPATYTGATMVASVENVSYPVNYMKLGDQEIVYSDSVGTFAVELAADGATEYEYVMVPGLGDVADFEQVDVAGKIAVVQRGSLAFTDKQTNAYDAGAIACIIYDNVEGSLINMQDAGLLPNVFVALAEAAVDGVGTITVMPVDDLITVDSEIAGLMSDFSSWGVTADLQLAPDVSAPGGNIYSCYTDGQYGLMSGTSMSAPHITGMSALVLEYLQENYNLSDAQTHTIAEALIMSTAEPVLEETGIEYSPRKQGSGEANVYNAVTSPAYLTVNGSTPSVSMGDDDSKRGNYSFVFELNNLSDEAQSYILDSTVLTDWVIDIGGGYTFMGESSYELGAQVKYSYIEDYDTFANYDVNGDGVFDVADVQYVLDVVNEVETGSVADLDGDGVLDTKDAQWLLDALNAMPVENATNMITVPAGETVIVTVNVVLSEEDKAYMDAYYPNGIYVDGFIRCYAVSEDAVDLSLPFMGFYGDWSAADVFDTAWYYDDDDTLYNRYPNYVLTDIYYLGMNPYIAEEYDPAHNVLSPNGDGAQDNLGDIYLGMMRSAKAINFTWKDEEGATLYNTTAQYVRKSYYISTAGICYPFVYSSEVNKGKNEEGTAYIPDFYDVSELEDGDKVTLYIDGYLDDGDNVADQSLDPITMVIDTTAPVVENVELVQDTVNNTRTLVVTASDNYDIAAIIPVTMAGDAFAYYAAEGEKTEDGETVKLEIDVSDFDSTFILAVCDYGANESYYEVSFDTTEGLNEDRFYSYRRYSAVTAYSSYYGQYVTYVTDAYNGWTSFETPDDTLTHTYMYNGETAVAAAEYIDGYVFGVDINGEIFVMKSGNWTRIPLGSMPEGRDSNYDYVPYPALDMAYDYVNDVLYILTDELKAGDGGHLMTLDYVTGEVTDLGVVKTVDDSQPLTLACDNFGTLYTIDYVSGDLYTIDPENIQIEYGPYPNYSFDDTEYIAAEYVAATGYVPQYTQTMTVDHETNTLYWMAYQGIYSDGASKLFQVNTETGELTAVSTVEYNSEMVALFKPFSPRNDIIEDAELIGIALSSESLVMSVGSVNALTAYPVPYNAKLTDVTWTSSDENIAVVEDGVIYAVGEGCATITATSGDLSAECVVDIIDLTSDLTLYDFGNYMYWQTFNAAAPGAAEYLMDGVSPYNGITAAAYYDGWVYASEYGGNFYRLDPETLQGTQIGNSGSTLMGLAFNYADGFLYGIEQYSASYWDVTNYVVRVNLNTGELVRVGEFDSGYSPMAYLAIDYDGNCYSIVGNNNTGSMELLKWTVSDAGMEVLSSWSMDEYPVYNYSSMVYSAEDNGLYYSNEVGQLFWIDMESLTEDASAPRIVSIGYIGESTGYAMNMGTFIVPNVEPETPDVEITSVNVPSSYMLLVGGSASTGVTVEPWNAHPGMTYAVADETVAAVDENGNITGLAAGKTTITITVEGWDTTYTVDVTVAEAAGELYGFLISDFLYSSDFFVQFSDTDPVNEVVATSDFTDFMVFSGAYYDGVIYGYGQDQTGTYNYKNYFLTIDAETFEMTQVAKVHYTLRDMAFDYTSGNLYAIAESEKYAGAVAQVDMQTGEVAIVADTGLDVAAMTIDAEGQMYVIGEDDNLYQVDKESGEATLIGATGANAGATYQSMHYDRNTGNTYWAQVADDSTSSLRLVDLTTGTTTSLGTISSSGAQIGCMYTIPENEPTEPDESTFKVTGVQLPEVGTVVAGQTLQLDATVLTSVVLNPKTAMSTASTSTASAAGVTVTWSSDDESVATVDQTGLVTGVAEGTAVITASAGGFSAQCEVTVTPGERLVYAYDKTNTRWISFSTSDPSTIVNEWDDAEEDTALIASVYTGETIYACDEDGKLYQIDADTFELTEVGDCFSGQTYCYMAEGTDYWTGETYTYEVECEMSVIDLAYDDGTLYAAVIAENADEWVEVTLVCEIDVDDGTYEAFYVTSEARMTNLMVEDGRAFFIDGFYSGILNYLDLYEEGASCQQVALVNGYWGDAAASVGMFRDELTGTVYALRDFTETDGTYDADGNYTPYDGVTGAATLCILNLADADIEVLGTIGTGLLIKGMFIK